MINRNKKNEIKRKVGVRNNKTESFNQASLIKYGSLSYINEEN